MQQMWRQGSNDGRQVDGNKRNTRMISERKCFRIRAEHAENPSFHRQCSFQRYFVAPLNKECEDSTFSAAAAP